jgi:predicted  nucleic acid-binding Zn-ribbon protein
MANTKELSVEDKLRAIYDLQLIDSRIDEIRNVRGELPLEVEDLEDEVAGLSTRSDKLKSELEVIEDLIKGKMQLTSTKRLSKIYKTTGNCT